MRQRWIGYTLLLVLMFSGRVLAQDHNQTAYNIGTPTLVNLYVSTTGDATNRVLPGT